MVVLTLTNCPLQLRGDLTKWMMEINTGVYVGKINARVREKVWQRVCENTKNGQAVLIFSTNNEQGFSILTHNTEWKPMDYEGLILMHKPKSKGNDECTDKNSIGFSKASKYEMAKKRRSTGAIPRIFLDIETTGLDPSQDRIIEIGMVKVLGDDSVEEYHQYVKSEKAIPSFITEITGIDGNILLMEGKEEKEILKEIKAFIGNATVLGYNVSFDVEFINKACDRNEIEHFILKTKDIMTLAKKKIFPDNYKLKTVAEHLGLNTNSMHRALEDCRIAKRIYDELNKK